MADTSSAGVDDVYARYRKLREDGGVHRSFQKLPTFYRYHHVEAILRNPDWGKGDALQGDQERRSARYHKSFMRQDPPQHTRLRRLVTKAFSASVVHQLRPRIQEIADQSLDAMLANGESDLIEGYARVIPLTVICQLLGVPMADRQIFSGWVETLSRGEDPDPSPEEQRNRKRASIRFRQYFGELAAERQQRLGEDLLSRLIQVRDSEDRLTDAELEATCVLIFFAGHETTVNLIGNGVLALLQNPGQLALLRDSGLEGQAWVDELLRYDTPVQMLHRTALEDLKLDGMEFKRGKSAMIMLGAANRDPEAFPEPDRLDLCRSGIRHLAFGQGSHYCIGAALARLEGEIAIGTLLRRAPRLALREPLPVFRDTVAIRGLNWMHVTLSR